MPVCGVDRRDPHAVLDGDAHGGAQLRVGALEVRLSPHRGLALAGADRGEAAVVLGNALRGRERERERLASLPCRGTLPSGGGFPYLVEDVVLLALLHEGPGGGEPHVELSCGSGAGEEGSEAGEDDGELHLDSGDSVKGW